jgi:hypothetical protein
MFKPVISMLDTFAVFDPTAHDAQSAKDREKMKAVRERLQRKHECVCWMTYTYRILRNDKKSKV